MFHVKHEGSTSSDPTPEQVERLHRFGSILRERGASLGLVSKADVPQLWVRHIQDSLRALPLIPSAARSLCDLGSGGGLPGIPLAIVRQDLDVTLTEPRRLRAGFLELVVEAVPVRNATVFAGPAADLGTQADVVVARGFGDARTTWVAAEPLLRPAGRLLYWAGATFSPEALPAGVLVELATEVTLESGGPIVIMTRQ
jgi:16S rRNA (guanine527-N7)-methyltransferase